MWSDIGWLLTQVLQAVFLTSISYLDGSLSMQKPIQKGSNVQFFQFSRLREWVLMFLNVILMPDSGLLRAMHPGNAAAQRKARACDTFHAS